jgi:hypothetical protein
VWTPCCLEYWNARPSTFVVKPVIGIFCHLPWPSLNCATCILILLYILYIYGNNQKYFMRRKCTLVTCKPVAIITTKVEHNLVTINPKQVSNPKYGVGFYFEISESSKKPWDVTYLRVLLVVHGMKYELKEMSDPDKRQNQTFAFTLLEEVSPQVESIIEQAIPDAL